MNNKTENNEEANRLAARFLGMWSKLNKYEDNVNKENLETLEDCVILMKNHVQEVENRVLKLHAEYSVNYANLRRSKRYRRSIIEKELGIDDIDWSDDYDFESFRTSDSESSSDSTKDSPSKRLKSSSLVDPEWEIVDPTPDIHSLFITFNRRFFWGALESVEVRWSPRMYSCAGLCSYQGRRGLCSVRLSEPLLKLRPRSDLVETLLHEMIHAYLFVTHNNRDRTGHGPEFHKHMHRINNEAGTNITVYHSFHDEVRLYQKHWWRCDGPCQFRPPFLGLVKRTMNRAPGPSDSWWANHQATCGGRFVKVREPLNAKFKQVQPDKTTNLPKLAGTSGTSGIKNYFNNTTTNKGSISNTNKPTLPHSNPAVSNLKNVSSNIHGITSTSTSDSSGFRGQNGLGISGGASAGGGRGGSRSGGLGLGSLRKPGDDSSQGVNRVVGFGDLRQGSTGPSHLNNVKKNVFGGSGQKLGGGNHGNPWKANGPRTGGSLMNRGGGTLVLTAKDGGQKSPKKPETSSFVPFLGQGQKLGNPMSGDGLAPKFGSGVRNRNGGEFSGSIGGARERSQSVPMNASFGPSVKKSATVVSKSETVSKSSSSSNNSGVSPDKSDLESVFNSSAVTISDEEFADVADFVDFESDSVVDGGDDVNCPVCNMSLKRDDMVIHLESCDVLKATMDNINSASSLESGREEDLDDEINEENDPCSQLIKDNVGDPLFPCPCCSKLVKESQINKHLDECLSLLAVQEFSNAF